MNKRLLETLLDLLILGTFTKVECASNVLLTTSIDYLRKDIETYPFVKETTYDQVPKTNKDLTEVLSKFLIDRSISFIIDFNVKDCPVISIGNVINPEYIVPVSIGTYNKGTLDNWIKDYPNLISDEVLYHLCSHCYTRSLLCEEQATEDVMFGFLDQIGDNTYLPIQDFDSFVSKFNSIGSVVDKIRCYLQNRGYIVCISDTSVNITKSNSLSHHVSLGFPKFKPVVSEGRVIEYGS